MNTTDKDNTFDGVGQEQSQTSSQADLLFHDRNFAIINSIKDISQRKDPFLVDGHLILLVSSGRANFYIDGEQISMQCGDLFVCSPRNIIDNAMFSMDFDVWGFFLTPVAVSSFLRSGAKIEVSSMLLRANSVIHLDDQEKRLFESYRNLFVERSQIYSFPSKSDVTKVLIFSMVTDIRSMFEKRIGDDAVTKNTSYSSAELLFQKFITKVHQSHNGFRSVNDYAEDLNITAKYLSSICKQITNKTALDILNEEKLIQARMLLRNPKLSIKQVSDELGFLNQSHFGSFMRRHTGMSPQKLRATM